MERKEKLIHLYNYSLNSEKESLAIFDEGDKRSIVNGLFFINRRFALHSLFISNDVAKTRGHFYIMAKLGLYRYQQFSVPIEYYHILFFAILSNDDAMIQHHLSLPQLDDGAQNMEETFVISHVYRGIRAIWQADQDLLIKSINGVESRAVKNDEDEDDDLTAYLPFATFFLGILKGDEKIITSGIYQILDKHDEMEDSIAHSWMSFEATVALKLAIKGGFNINIEHALIPQSLLDSSTSMDFEMYSFLDSELL